MSVGGPVDKAAANINVLCGDRPIDLGRTIQRRFAWGGAIFRDVWRGIFPLLSGNSSFFAKVGLDRAWNIVKCRWGGSSVASPKVNRLGFGPKNGAQGCLGPARYTAVSKQITVFSRDIVAGPF